MVKLGIGEPWFQIHNMYDDDSFFVQNFISCETGCSFWYIFCEFLQIFDNPAFLEEEPKGKH